MPTRTVFKLFRRPIAPFLVPYNFKKLTEFILMQRGQLSVLIIQFKKSLIAYGHIPDGANVQPDFLPSLKEPFFDKNLITLSEVYFNLKNVAREIE